MISLIEMVGIVQKCLHGDTQEKAMEPFLLFRVSRAGLFCGLSAGEFCPLPLFPSASLGARGFPHR
jgi:hypothetical protein